MSLTMAFILYIIYSDHLFSFENFQTDEPLNAPLRFRFIQFALLLSPPEFLPASLSFSVPFPPSSPVYHTLRFYPVF